MNLIKLYARVLGLLDKVKGTAIMLAVANTAIAITQFAEPILFGWVVDALVRAAAAQRAPQWGELAPLLIFWAVFGLFTIGAGVLVALHSDRLAHRQKVEVVRSYFEHILQLPQQFHGESHSGRLSKVLWQGADALWGMWLSFFRDHCSALVAVIVLMPLTLFINWRLAILLIILALIFLILTSLVMKKTETLQRQVEGYYTDMAERAQDTIGNVALVQSFARVQAEVEGLKQVTDRMLAAQLPVLSWWAIVAVATRASTTLTVLSIFVVGTWLHLQGLATIGEIVTFVNFAGLVIARLEQVSSFVSRVFLEAPKLIEFFQVYDTLPTVREKPDAIDPGRLTGRVVFDNVSFSYDGKRPALADVSFTVEPGETIALVGTTGAGKTTALSMLHRVFDPQSGKVTVDGLDLRDMKLVALRRNIGVVFQEALLFNRSIEDNLLVGKPDATPDEMRLALERAQAADFIARQTQGMKATVGERGRALSGGERQRLSIARALLKDPPILILDEATSALDAATEIKVQAALDEVMKGRTTFVIAHRLATIRNANRIFVFEHGRIVEAGSFDDLVKLGGRFAGLAKAQFMVGDPSPASGRDVPPTAIAET